MRQMYEKLYSNISLKRSKYSQLYYPIFMIRRFLFIIVPLSFQNKPGIQLSLLIFLSSLYIIWYIMLWPHNMRKLVYIELTNEVFFMILNYHMVAFTLFNPDLQTQFNMGWSYLLFMGLLILVNLTFVATNVISKARRKKYLLKLR